MILKTIKLFDEDEIKQMNEDEENRKAKKIEEQNRAAVKHTVKENQLASQTRGLGPFQADKSFAESGDFGKSITHVAKDVLKIQQKGEFLDIRKSGVNDTHDAYSEEDESLPPNDERVEGKLLTQCREGMLESPMKKLMHDKVKTNLLA